MNIKIYNRQRVLKLDLKKLRRIAKFVVQNELDVLDLFLEPGLLPQSSEFGVYLVDKVKMTKLNQKTFGKNHATDVISFGYVGEELLFMEEGVLGEVFISVDQAVRAAKVLKTSTDYELLLYLVHGILHVFGYEDKNRKQRQEMRARENFYMDLFSLMETVIRS
jgi:probable rRNA maturation factor